MIMKYRAIIVFSLLAAVHRSCARCTGQRTATFTRWSGVSPVEGAPIFVYSASGDEESLTGACLSLCRELEDCGAVVVAYGKGSCHGISDAIEETLKTDNDMAYFKKICLDLPKNCSSRWWALESTPGYHLSSEGPNLKVVLNTTLEECYDVILSGSGDRVYRSAQWVDQKGVMEGEIVHTSEKARGNCVLNLEDKFTEPESYRVSNYNTFYIENQCRHDYQKKIDRCSYEEYYNQTLKHTEVTAKNYTKDEPKDIRCWTGASPKDFYDDRSCPVRFFRCAVATGELHCISGRISPSACELEQRFVCRGFTWSSTDERRGLCDLHSEDMVTTGSWLLRRVPSATYYRRVICLNITVECEGPEMIVTYRPRGVFRGRVYVPGRGEQCSARATTYGGVVRLPLPLQGDCDVNFAYAIYNGPNGVVNRTMAYVMVMVQNNPIIQTAGDRWVRVGCSPGSRTAAHVNTTVAVKDSRKPQQASESTSDQLPVAASAIYSANSAPLSMYVVRGDDAGGAVSLGESLELRIETTDTSEIEAYHLVASSRLGDSSVLLLDSRGCPTGQVDFPAFTRTWLAGTQRLSARFKAFRFPTSHIVRFALMVRFCEDKCVPVDCTAPHQTRSTRQTNDTLYEFTDENEGVPATVQEDEGWEGVVAQGGTTGCGGSGRVPLELEMVVGGRDVLTTDHLMRADHSAIVDESRVNDGSLVCVHELLLVSLALAWLAVQVMLLLGCCVLVNRYRNLAEMSMQKDYHSFDNVGFDTVSTHRRVHWPDQNIDILHTT